MMMALAGITHLPSVLVPGGVTLPFYDAVYDSHIKHILVRHEENAAFAAAGYARATGKVGVCCATSAGAGWTRCSPPTWRARGPKPMAVTCRPLRADSAAAWDRFVDAMPEGTFFHRAAWAEIYRGLSAEPA